MIGGALHANKTAKWSSIAYYHHATRTVTMRVTESQVITIHAES